MTFTRISLLLLSLIAPVLYITGPVLSQAGIELEFLSLISNKTSYFFITISNAVAFIIATKDKNIELSIVFGLWTGGMGTMFLLH